MANEWKNVPHREQARRPTYADVIDRVLDKGIVVEYRVTRVSVLGVDLPVTVNARFLIASLDTSLEYKWLFMN